MLGYAWVQHDNFFRNGSTDSGLGVALYYLSSMMGLPIFSMGFRF